MNNCINHEKGRCALLKFITVTYSKNLRFIIIITYQFKSVAVYLFFNASDLFNTFRIKKEINGNGFKLLSNDYYETQVFRIGYSYKF